MLLRIFLGTFLKNSNRPFCVTPYSVLTALCEKNYPDIIPNWYCYCQLFWYFLISLNVFLGQFPILTDMRYVPENVNVDSHSRTKLIKIVLVNINFVCMYYCTIYNKLQKFWIPALILTSNISNKSLQDERWTFYYTPIQG